MHGLETTVPVTLDMMILQGRAVMRGSKRALVVVDMPFGSYEASKEQAFRSAARDPEGDAAAARSSSKAASAWPRPSPFPGRARHSGDGPYRADAAVDQHARRRSGAQGRDEAELGADREGRPGGRRRPARSRW